MGRVCQVGLGVGMSGRPGFVGIVGELKVAHRLLEVGWNVAFPEVDDEGVDLIAFKPGRYVPVQVRDLAAMVGIEVGDEMEFGGPIPEIRAQVSSSNTTSTKGLFATQASRFLKENHDRGNGGRRVLQAPMFSRIWRIISLRCSTSTIAVARASRSARAHSLRWRVNSGL